jgi:hypothetical protein
MSSKKIDRYISKLFIDPINNTSFRPRSIASSGSFLWNRSSTLFHYFYQPIKDQSQNNINLKMDEVQLEYDHRSTLNIIHNKKPSVPILSSDILSDYNVLPTISIIEKNRYHKENDFF